MNSFIIFILILSCIGFIFILRQVNYIFADSEFLLIIHFCTLSLFINLIIFFYITATFKNMDLRPGLQGPKGIRGARGLQGQADTCQTCKTQENSVGYEFLQDKFENQVVIEKPLLDPKAAEKDPWKDVLGKRVKIFTKKGGKICGLQWHKPLAGISVISSTDKAAILDCSGNADIFIISKVGSKYYIQNLLGKAKEDKGPIQKTKKATLKCGLAMTRKAGGTPFTRGTEHTGFFNCTEAQPIYLRGTPESFRMLMVNKNEFTCEAKVSAPAGELNDLESYERLLKFNCVEEGEKFYLEII